jgi:hypothetical protein
MVLSVQVVSDTKKRAVLALHEELELFDRDE